MVGPRRRPFPYTGPMTDQPQKPPAPRIHVKGCPVKGCDGYCVYRTVRRA